MAFFTLKQLWWKFGTCHGDLMENILTLKYSTLASLIPFVPISTKLILQLELQLELQLLPCSQKKKSKMLYQRANWSHSLQRRLSNRTKRWDIVTQAFNTTWNIMTVFWKCLAQATFLKHNSAKHLKGKVRVESCSN